MLLHRSALWMTTGMSGSVDDILQHCGYDLDVGGQMQVEDGADLLRNKIDEAHKNVSEAVSLLDSLRWLLL